MSFLRVDLYSDVLSRSVSVNIILPEPAPEGPVPCLYLLHGMTDDYSGWTRNTSVERYANDNGFAVVMPDGYLSWYCNTPSGERYFDYVSDELVRLTRRLIPSLSRDREDTFVGGLSMGGYGALKCALARSDTFAGAICLSGGYDPDRFEELIDPGTAKDFVWSSAFGPIDSVRGSENDVYALAVKSMPVKPRVYMWCGTDDSLLSMSRGISKVLKENGFPIYYHETPGGHEWALWDRELRAALPLIRSKEAFVCH